MTEPHPNADPAEVAAVAKRFAALRERIAAAARQAGRSPEEITLVAVSKTVPAERIAAAIAAGQLTFGENRVQEAARKFPTLRRTAPGLKLHLIGALQTNKAREAVRLFDVIESLDRPRLADALAAAADKEGRLPRLYVEVNLGDEPQKSGIPRAEADAFIEACRARFGEALVGVMGIPPVGVDPRPHFAWLAACARRHGLPVISMGMSEDFEAAIAAGATEIRLGRALFGERPTTPRLPSRPETD
jgi:pyridoxal phosphate enzyme (YggS family)